MSEPSPAALAASISSVGTAPARTILFTGGCRSGKSGLAQRWVEALGPSRVYIATGAARDAEMAERVRRHQAARGTGWRTVEEQLDVCAALRGCMASCAGQATAQSLPQPRPHGVLLDCITLWLTNRMLADHDDAAILRGVEGLAALLRSATVPVAVVTNEVGWGVVPETPLGRRFRDLSGEANQLLATACTDVILAISGLPLAVKGGVPAACAG
ncbi:bifunctional adenosylcobinamide kinase/adenosylcobinamide-phosphate guanylyltransferase [Nitratidesulfovibrio liaohensis]|uniref:bifunctional adenosylcobinamide kinase/adenosylcobinamide-phosphate guanylyltransferase n=1 Tax=Nitratidesulfovibrio liaohensis TaxID=2604158 RepID=UPI001AAFEEA0|nr:bifunctional adenosylcobinamide kinase/adenosylcobinamide-phosphate guanylyltransferase [Nitratidesulfovibrio liaohensis]